MYKKRKTKSKIQKLGLKNKEKNKTIKCVLIIRIIISRLKILSKNIKVKKMLIRIYDKVRRHIRCYSARAVEFSRIGLLYPVFVLARAKKIVLTI